MMSMLLAAEDHDKIEKIQALMADYEDSAYEHDECKLCGCTVMPSQRSTHSEYHRTLTFAFRLQGHEIDHLAQKLVEATSLMVQIGEEMQGALVNIVESYIGDGK